MTDTMTYFPTIFFFFFLIIFHGVQIYGHTQIKNRVPKQLIEYQNNWLKIKD